MQTMTLRELLADSRDGEWGKGEAASGRVEMRVIRGTDFSDIRQGDFHGVPVRYLEQRHADRKRLNYKDILIETAGGTAGRPTGRTAFVTRRVIDALGDDITCASFARFLRIDEGKAEPEYVFWLLQHHYERRNLLQFHLQHTGVARFQFTTFANTFPLRLPEREEQRRVASILGAYDDLIEVNRRRIAVLEEMARRLFEEWFVRFRFPGHEGHNIVETPDGPLPEGWKAGSANNLIDFDPSTKVPKDGRKPFVSMSSLSTDTSLIGDIEWREGNSGAKFANGDTLFARITPCLENGKTGLVRDLPGEGVGFGSTEFIVMRGTRAGSAFCYELARNADFREHARRSMSGATGRQRARTESLRSFAMRVPPTELLASFEDIAGPLLELSGTLGASNGRLASARDLLLPRLISGELSVAAAERELEVVA